MDISQPMPGDVTANAQSDAPRTAWGQPKLAASPEAVRSLPAEFAKQHRILPLEARNGILRIATAQPGNQRVIDDIRLLTGLEVEEAEAPASQIAGEDRGLLPGDGRADDRKPRPGHGGQRSRARICTTSR